MEFRENVVLAPHTNFRIGGPADLLVEVKNSSEILEAISYSQEKGIKFVVVGDGKNILVSDEGFRGLVIKITGGSLEIQGNKIICDAGANLNDVIKASVESGLSGMETLSGIPGSVGGAVFGNAGAYGQSISDVVGSVEIFDGRDTRIIKKGECEFGYRDSVFKRKPWIVLRVTLDLVPSKEQELLEISRPILETRAKKFPWDMKCAGSYFKNVLVRELSEEVLGGIDKSKIIGGKIPAGYLLDSVGARGMSVGGIRVRDSHSNILFNDGSGSAKEVIELADRLKMLVKKKFGITLEEEVRYIA